MSLSDDPEILDIPMQLIIFVGISAYTQHSRRCKFSQVMLPNLPREKIAKTACAIVNEPAKVSPGVHHFTVWMTSLSQMGKNQTVEMIQTEIRDWAASSPWLGSQWYLKLNFRFEPRVPNAAPRSNGCSSSVRNL